MNIKTKEAHKPKLEFPIVIGVEIINFTLSLLLSTLQNMHAETCLNEPGIDIKKSHQDKNNLRFANKNHSNILLLCLLLFNVLVLIFVLAVNYVHFHILSKVRAYN